MRLHKYSILLHTCVQGAYGEWSSVSSSAAILEQGYIDQDMSRRFIKLRKLQFFSISAEAKPGLNQGRRGRQARRYHVI